MLSALGVPNRCPSCPLGQHTVSKVMGRMEFRVFGLMRVLDPKHS